MDKRELALEDFLCLKEKEDIEAMCAFFQVDHGTGWTKAEMAKALAEAFRGEDLKLFEVIPREGLHFLSELFEKDCILRVGPTGTGYVPENEADYLDAMRSLEDSGLIHLEMDPHTGTPLSVTTPCALKAVMLPFVTAEGMEEARVYDMMAYFVRGMLYYYGAVEIARLLRMVRVFLPGFPEDIFEILLNVRGNLRPYVHLEMVHEKVYVFAGTAFEPFLDEEREMAEMVEMVEGRGDIEYRRFSPAELLKAAQPGFLENRDGYERVKAKLKEFLIFKPRKHGEDIAPFLPPLGEEGQKDLEADLLLQAITYTLRSTGDVASTFSSIERVSDFPSAEDRRRMEDEFLFYADNLSRFGLRGHTPNELRNIGKGGKVLPFRKTRKVGRNDPCPCGSGKKYKNCHGGVKNPGTDA